MDVDLARLETLLQQAEASLPLIAEGVFVGKWRVDDKAAVDLIDAALDALPHLLQIAKAAQDVERIYEGLRQGADDGEFALWSEDDLIVALHNLRPALEAFDGARSLVTENPNEGAKA